MAQYLALTACELQKVAHQFRLKIVNSEPFQGGASNSNYLLETNQEQYVLTVFDNKTSAEAHQICEVLRLLEKNNFPAPRLKMATDSGLSVEFAGKPIIVKNYIVGGVEKDLSDHMLHDIGKTMADLHTIPALPTLKSNYSYPLELFHEVFDANVDPEYESWLASRHEFFQKYFPKELPRGLIHADLFYDNVLFDDLNLTAFLDFEDVCYYFKAFDLAMGMLGLCQNGAKLNFEKAKSFLAGYQNTRKLEKIEIEFLQILLDFAITSMSYWRFWKYRIRYQIKGNEMKHWEMVRIADFVHAIPKDEFIQLVFPRGDGS